MLIPAIVMLGAGAGGGWWYFQQAGEAAAASNTPTVAAPIYMTIEPAFVVNLADGAYIRFLKVDVELMARSQQALERVRVHSPAIRNELIMLFSSGDYAALMTRAGKEALQVSALEAINAQITLYGEEQVEALYFTGFVVQ
jgi:flagellar FliL protein